LIERTEAPLERHVVARAALSLIEKRGLHRLSVRAAAATLGVDPAALTESVTGRADLLDAVAALLLHEANLDPSRHVSISWQGHLHAVAHSLRRVAMTYPAAFSLLATPSGDAPWLWPPLRSVAFAEQLITMLVEFGLNDDQAVATYRGFVNFILSRLLLEAAVLAEDQRRAAKDQRRAAEAPVASRLPTVPVGTILLRLHPLLDADRAAEEFEIALESLLDRLEQSLA